MAASAEPHGLLIVDKASGPTSHDVVGIARRVLGTRAIGHTGTLDPMATGVLVLAIGEATKLVNALGSSRKIYEATVLLGRSTTTLDAQGEVDGEAPVPVLELAKVQSVLDRFLGEHEQRAPNVSAIKVEGRALYKRARKGEEFEAPLRRVRLEAVQVRALSEQRIDLTLTCGSGFYVRAFARDVAAALGTLGHLSALRRIENGGYHVNDAVTFEQLKAARTDPRLAEAVRGALLPLRSVCRTLPHGTLDEAGVVHARHGRALALTHLGCADASAIAGPVLALDSSGDPVALLERREDSLHVLRGFRLL